MEDFFFLIRGGRIPSWGSDGGEQEAGAGAGAGGGRLHHHSGSKSERVSYSRITLSDLKQPSRPGSAGKTFG